MMNPVEGGRIDCPLLRYYGVNAKLDAVLSQLTIEEFYSSMPHGNVRPDRKRGFRNYFLH